MNAIKINQIMQSNDIGQFTSMRKASHENITKHSISPAAIYVPTKEDEEYRLKMAEEDIKRIEILQRNLFNEFGIKGKITGWASRTTFQADGSALTVSVYYIETEDPKARNKVLMQINDGDFHIGETDMDWETVSNRFFDPQYFDKFIKDRAIKSFLSELTR